MRGRIFILLTFAALLSSIGLGQSQSDDQRLRDIVRQYGQAEVTVPYSTREALDYLSRNVSVLNAGKGLIEISLSRLTVEWFINEKLSYRITEKAISRGIVTAPTMARAIGFDIYPTYPQYDSIMRSFAADYPALCRLDTIGSSIRGKLVLVLRITGNQPGDIAKPQVFYTSTMHGDETGGFILMLRLADSLLRSYNDNDRVRELVDNLEIWINPLANPDGTYNSGNTIISPVRYNADGVDLNRNFPDPSSSPSTPEKETADMISFMTKHRFVLSANFHSGTEVVNYPWDRWLSILHADNNWFNDISRAYADTAHIYSDPSYMRYLDNGVTRGAVWYIVHGGRQDFVTQQLHGREVTIELDNDYVTPVSLLPVLWENNRRSLTGYLENALYGIHGFVKDSESLLPVPAEIFIQGHDKDSSEVYSDGYNGSFVRMIEPGLWPLTFMADGYRDTTVDVQVTDMQRTDITVYMVRGTNPSDSVQGTASLYPNPASSVIYAVVPDKVAGKVNVSIVDQSGRYMIYFDTEISMGIPLQIDIGRLTPGTYSAVFFNAARNKSCRGRFIVIK